MLKWFYKQEIVFDWCSIMSRHICKTYSPDQSRPVGHLDFCTVYLWSRFLLLFPLNMRWLWIGIPFLSSLPSDCRWPGRDFSCWLAHYFLSTDFWDNSPHANNAKIWPTVQSGMRIKVKEGKGCPNLPILQFFNNVQKGGGQTHVKKCRIRNGLTKALVKA